MAIQALLLLL